MTAGFQLEQIGFPFAPYLNLFQKNINYTKMHQSMTQKLQLYIDKMQTSNHNWKFQNASEGLPGKQRFSEKQTLNLVLSKKEAFLSHSIYFSSLILNALQKLL